MYDGYSNTDFFDFAIKDNYLYLFTPKKTIRYVISESILSTDESIDINKELNFNNPFNDELIFNTDEKIKAVEFYDQNGRLVLKSRKINHVNTSSLKKGIYMMKISMENDRIISKKGTKN